MVRVTLGEEDGMSNERQVILGLNDDARENLAQVDRTAALLSEQITKFARRYAGDIVLGIALQNGSVNDLASIVGDCKMLVEGIELLKRRAMP
jgi:hypothetical protein